MSFGKRFKEAMLHDLRRNTWLVSKGIWAVCSLYSFSVGLGLLALVIYGSSSMSQLELLVAACFGALFMLLGMQCLMKTCEIKVWEIR